MMRPATRPWWQQATALVSLSAGGAITGFSFAPGTAANLASPTGMPIRLLALQHSAQQHSAQQHSAQSSQSRDDGLRSAIVNVARYYLRMAEHKSPGEMAALIWQYDSLDGADHGESCAAFASLTLELAAHVVGQSSWVTGGATYPWPLHTWADVRVEPNPASPGITSILQDAQAHHRWHPVGDGYEPLPGDWVLFDGHVEVVTDYTSGVLQTIGADSPPNYSVNAHQYRDPVAAQGVLGFVNNGDLGAAAVKNAGSPGHAAGGSAGGSPGGSPGGSAGGSAGRRPAPATEAPGPPAIPGASGADAADPAQPAPPADGAAIPGTTASAPGPSTRASGPTASATGRSASASGRSASGSGPSAAASPDVPPTGPSGRSAGSGATAPGAAAIPGIPGQRVPAGSPSSSAAPYSRHLPPPTTTPVHDTSAQQAFINGVAPGAVAAQHAYGVPAAVTIAQAIDESAWGRSELARKDHNLFGIKGAGPAGSDPLPTQEYENGQWVTITTLFRVYDNVAESIDDHGRIIAGSGYYGHAMANRGDPNAFADGLTGVYATSPDYGAKLISLMQQYNLYSYGLRSPAGRQARPAQAKAPAPAKAPTPAKVPPAAPAPAPSRPAPGAAGGAAIPGLADSSGSAPVQQPRPGPSPGAHPAPGLRPLSPAQARPASPAQARRASPARPRPATRASRSRYQARIPLAVEQAFITKAKVPLRRSEPLYRDVASHSGIRWELMAACDWMQCQAQPRHSPVHGEKLGTVNPDGTVYRTKSEALEQCADDLVELAATVYGVDLTARNPLSLNDLADAFAAFRWGGLLKLHRTSAMEFPYSVEGLTAQHINMRWPNIAEPNAPDKPGGRFRRPFGAVPIVLSLDYPVTA
jgi:hypothetical protein